jgi:hypothetical protein
VSSGSHRNNGSFDEAVRDRKPAQRGSGQAPNYAVAHVPVKWIYPMARLEGAHRAALVEKQILALGQMQGL